MSYLSPLRSAMSTLFPYTTLFRSRKSGSFSDPRWPAPPPAETSPAPAYPPHPPPPARTPSPHTPGNPAAADRAATPRRWRSEEHTSELQSHVNLVCRLLLETKK